MDTLTDRLRKSDQRKRSPSKNGTGHQSLPTGGQPWEPPLPLSGDRPVPALPLDCFPPVLANFIEHEAEATQTPPDLAALTVLAICGAGLAKKFRVQIRDDWTEPTNLYCVTALPPGDRKTAVHSDVTAPVQLYEQEKQQEMQPLVAEALTEHRTLENRLKEAEKRAAKAEPEESAEALRKCKELARELADHKVPAVPVAYLDDVTPEELPRQMASQGGRMLVASAEGTIFEIAHGRYSEGRPKLEVFLKGHSGDPLRVHRVSRPADVIEQPALSMALAVQPDVIRGLADTPAMRGRGFLARPFYSIPKSKVGARRIAPRPMSPAVRQEYIDTVLTLWRIPAEGTPTVLVFSAAAEQTFRQSEEWLEPQLAEGEELATLAGWASKLAGGIARISGILHVVEAIQTGRTWNVPISESTVAKAIRFGRDYLLPHALAAFAVMGSDPRLDDARRVLKWLNSLICLNCLNAPPLFVTKSQIHSAVFGGRRSVDEVDEVICLLEKHNYFREVQEQQDFSHRRGRKPSTRYEVNPLIQKGDPGSDKSEKGDAYEG
jgi:replicative DNA helicase